VNNLYRRITELQIVNTKLFELSGPFNDWKDAAVELAVEYQTTCMFT
jgi:hypothetical protein